MKAPAHTTWFWFRRQPGPERHLTGPVVVSLTDYRMHSLRSLLGIARTGTRLVRPPPAPSDSSCGRLRQAPQAESGQAGVPQLPEHRQRAGERLLGVGEPAAGSVGQADRAQCQRLAAPTALRYAASRFGTGCSGVLLLS